MSVSRRKKMVHRLYTLIAAAESRPPRGRRPIIPFPPGPATLKRLTAGMLIVETARQVADQSPHRDLLVAEFSRRGLHECASLVETGDIPEDLHSADAFDPALDKAVVQIYFSDTDAIFDPVAARMDATDEEFDQYVHKTMLSPAEQIDDLIAVGAPLETIDAFIAGQGVSTISRSVHMAAEISHDAALGHDSELLAVQEQSQDTGLSL